MNWLASILLLGLLAHDARFEYREGGIIRGPTAGKKIALEFTGDEFTEGGSAILNALAAHHAKGSFFLTGRCLRNPAHEALVRRVVAEGHYLGPHSDTHPLLCPWTGPKKTLVTREFFDGEMERNIMAIERYGVKHLDIQYVIPPYEWYNEEIAQWAGSLNLNVVNFTPGTRSNADYTEDGASNFVSSQAILLSILAREKNGGLNGYLLLFHIGAGPKRIDKMSDHLGDLIAKLQARGYQFVRVDELLAEKP